MQSVVGAARGRSWDGIKRYHGGQVVSKRFRRARSFVQEDDGAAVNLLKRRSSASLFVGFPNLLFSLCALVSVCSEGRVAASPQQAATEVPLLPLDSVRAGKV